MIWAQRDVRPSRTATFCDVSYTIEKQIKTEPRNKISKILQTSIKYFILLHSTSIKYFILLHSTLPELQPTTKDSIIFGAMIDMVPLYVSHIYTELLHLVKFVKLD